MTVHHLAQLAAPERNRRRQRRLLAVVLVVALMVSLSTYCVAHRYGSRCVGSAVAARAVTDLDVYVDWLHRNHARGFIGEVGWPAGPDAAAWNAVAQRWYEVADREGLWVTAWTAGRWWPDNYPLAIYRFNGQDGRPLAGPQTKVLQGHPGRSGTWRGLNLPGGTFAAGQDGPDSYSAAQPGRFGVDYYYDSLADLRQIASTGATVVRVGVTWERLQHHLGGPLDAREIARLDHTLRSAESIGLRVILDVHSYGSYWVPDGNGHRRLVLGTSVTDAQFVDLWRRLSAEFRNSRTIVGYGLMNEPTKLAPDPAEGVRQWEQASQSAVDAIRAAGDHHTVLVSGYGGASPGQWTRFQPRAWIVDPAGQVRYEAHQYFDADSSGRYRESFEAEESEARANGIGCLTARQAAT